MSTANHSAIHHSLTTNESVVGSKYACLAQAAGDVVGWAPRTLGWAGATRVVCVDCRRRAVQGLTRTLHCFTIQISPCDQVSGVDSVRNSIVRLYLNGRGPTADIQSTISLNPSRRVT